MEPFDHERGGDWLTYVKRFEQHLTANRVTEEGKNEAVWVQWWGQRPTGYCLLYFTPVQLKFSKPVLAKKWGSITLSNEALSYKSLGALNNQLPRPKYNRTCRMIYIQHIMKSESEAKQTWTGVTTRMCTVWDYTMRHAATTFAIWPWLASWTNHVLMVWSMSQQRAIKPRTQDSQRKSLQFR